MEEGGGDRALENLVSAVQGHLRVESLAATGATKNRLLHFWKPVKPGLGTTSASLFSFSFYFCTSWVFLEVQSMTLRRERYCWSLLLLPEDFDDI